MTRLSVHDVIRSASTAVTDANFKLLEFEKVFPAQVSSLLLLLLLLLLLITTSYLCIDVILPIKHLTNTFISVVICYLKS